MTQMTGPGTQPEETLGALFATASRDLSTLVRSEVELAKAEIRADVKNGVTGGAMFGAAAFLGVLAVILLSIALAQGLVRAGVVSWLAFLIVAVFYLAARRCARPGRQEGGLEARPAGADDPHQQGDRGVPQEPAVHRWPRAD